MKLQMKILLFMACLNFAVYLAVTLSLPSTSYFQGQMPTSNIEAYEEHFNATELADLWAGPTIITGIPIIGDIFSGLYFALQNLLYLVDGFPQFLDWINYTYITDATGQFAFLTFSYTFRAIFGILMAIMVIEFIAGRYFTT